MRREQGLQFLVSPRLVCESLSSSLTHSQVNASKWQLLKIATRLGIRVSIRNFSPLWSLHYMTAMYYYDHTNDRILTSLGTTSMTFRLAKPFTENKRRHVITVNRYITNAKQNSSRPRVIITERDKKLITRWDSERELSLRRYRKRTTISISSICAEAVCVGTQVY